MNFSQRALLVLLTFSLVLAAFTSIDAQSDTSLIGVFSVTYGDHPTAPTMLYELTTPNLQKYQLNIDEATLEAAGGLLALNGHTVLVELNARSGVSGANAEGTPVSVRAITLIPGDKSASLEASGAAATTQTWLNLLCKFSDISTTNRTAAQIDAFFGSTYPLADHFWHEVSYDQISTSADTFDWVTLSHPRSYYYNATTLNLSAILTDCVAAYGSTVNVNNYYGINLFLNGDLGGYFYGSACSYVSLQGTTTCWRTTWLPITSIILYQDVITHEMGHARGLPHANNSDGDSDPYDDFYDLMSGHACGVYTPSYSCIGQHTSSAYKDALGWIDPAREFVLSSAGSYTITLDRLAMRNSTNYLAAFIPIDANRYYAIEARRNTDGDYDATLTDSGVIIHEVDVRRTEPAWQTNAMSDGASRFGPGVWQPGETYTNYADGFSVTVNGTTADGYSVTFYKGVIGTPQPDLSIALQADTSAVNQARYRVQVTNMGAGTATGATLLFDLPASLLDLTPDPSLECETLDYISYVCALGSMASGEQRSFTFESTPLVNGSVTFSAVVALNETDPTPANNKASVTSTASSAPDIRVTVTHDSDIVAPYDTITHHITVANVGGQTAVNLSFSAPLPAGIEPLGWSWGYYGSGFTCNFVQESYYSCLSANVYPGSELYLDLYSYAAVEGSYEFKTAASIYNSDANPADNKTSLVTIVGIDTALHVSITLQGRPAAPDPLLSVPLVVRVTPDGEITPVIDTTMTTDENGSLTLDGLSAGTYSLWVKGSHTLSRTTTITVPTGNILDFGTLPEGDTDDNNLVNLTDFSLLATTFGKQTGDAGYDGRADFNGDEIVNLTDFSLLATNFGQSGAS